MGSDASVFEFDYQCYVDEVVPAFHRLLLTGEMAPWLQAIWDQKIAYNGPYYDLTRLRRTDLLRHCTYLRAADLAFPARIVRKLGRSAPWEMRSCKSEMCPERAVCPFHANSSAELWEDLIFFFEEAVETRCLPRGQFVGRTMYSERYAPVLEALGISEEHSIRGLLSALGSRGYVIEVDGGDLEGIHGWLTPAETALFWKELDQLDLPRYPASYDEMRQILKKVQADRELYHEEFGRISLSFVRTVSCLATERGMGLLWGNDVLTSEERRKLFS